MLVRDLRGAVAEYVAHYHLERNHQGLANALIDGPADSGDTDARIKRRDPARLADQHDRLTK